MALVSSDLAAKRTFVRVSIYVLWFVPDIDLFAQFQATLSFAGMGG
jgi:hypothetical protein